MRNFYFYKQQSVLLAIILSSMMMLQLFTEGSYQYIQMSSAIAIGSALFLLISKRSTKKINSLVLALYFVLISIILINSYRSIDTIGMSALLRGSAVIVALVCGIFIAAVQNSNLLKDTLTHMSQIFLIVLFFVLFDNDRLWTRLAGHLHPNLWGFLAASFVPGVMFLKTGIIRKIIIIFAYFYFILFEFQTRGSFIWSALVILLFTSAYLLSPRYSYSSALIRLAIIWLIVFAAFFVLSFFGYYLLFEVLDMNSSSRGIGSGLSGRTEIWASVLDKFLESPLIGHGLDSSRLFVSQYFSEDLVSTHNTFVTVLFEFGVSGLTVYVLAIILSLWGVYKHKNFELLAFLLVYNLSGLTESRPLNVGNPSSLFFLFTLPYCTSLAFKKTDDSKSTLKV